MSITVFSKSISGYNRREVDEYIANLNRSYQASRRDYEKKIEILEAETEKLREQLAKLLSAQTEPQKAVEEPEAPAPAEPETAEKARRYDEISQQLGEILMNANAEASIRMREADEKVAHTLNSTMSGIRTELSSLIEKLGSMLADAESELDPGDGDVN